MPFDIQGIESIIKKGYSITIDVSASVVFTATRDKPLEFEDKINLANEYARLAAMIMNRASSTSDKEAVADFKEAEQLRVRSNWGVVRDIFEQETPDFAFLSKTASLKDYAQLSSDALFYKFEMARFAKELAGDHDIQRKMLEQVFSNIVQQREPRLVVGAYIEHGHDYKNKNNQNIDR